MTNINLHQENAYFFQNTNKKQRIAGEGAVFYWTFGDILQEDLGRGIGVKPPTAAVTSGWGRKQRAELGHPVRDKGVLRPGQPPESLPRPRGQRGRQAPALLQPKVRTRGPADKQRQGERRGGLCPDTRPFGRPVRGREAPPTLNTGSVGSPPRAASAPEVPDSPGCPPTRAHGGPLPRLLCAEHRFRTRSSDRSRQRVRHPAGPAFSVSTGDTLSAVAARRREGQPLRLVLTARRQQSRAPAGPFSTCRSPRGHSWGAGRGAGSARVTGLPGCNHSARPLPPNTGRLWVLCPRGPQRTGRRQVKPDTRENDAIGRNAANRRCSGAAVRPTVSRRFPSAVDTLRERGERGAVTTRASDRRLPPAPARAAQPCSRRHPRRPAAGCPRGHGPAAVPRDHPTPAARACCRPECGAVRARLVALLSHSLTAPGRPRPRRAGPARQRGSGSPFGANPT